MMIDIILVGLLGFLIGRMTTPPRIILVEEEVMDIDDPRIPDDVRDQVKKLKDRKGR